MSEGKSLEHNNGEFGACTVLLRASLIPRRWPSRLTNDPVGEKRQTPTKVQNRPASRIEEYQQPHAAQGRAPGLPKNSARRISLITHGATWTVEHVLRKRPAVRMWFAPEEPATARRSTEIKSLLFLSKDAKATRMGGDSGKFQQFTFVYALTVQ